MCKNNVFLNFIQNQQGQHVLIQMVGGRIVEGKAVMINLSNDIALQPFIEEADGTLVQPTYDAQIALVWPKYHTKWVNAEDWGDNAEFEREWAFLMNEPDDDFYDEVMDDEEL